MSQLSSFPTARLLLCLLVPAVGCDPPPASIGGNGDPCTHDGQLEGESLPWFTAPTQECDGGICLLIRPPDEVISCTSDADCNGPQEDLFVCQDGDCALAPGLRDELSLCTTTCASDNDCAGMENENCPTGFTCERHQGSGDLCCEGVCQCRRYGDAVADQQCEAGTLEGCCVVDGIPVDPQPAGCGPL